MKCVANNERRAARGSVLILVVAVLALLVLMGTAYLVSARTDRANATAMSNANNIELAQSAAMNQVLQVIGNGASDSGSQVLGYGSASGQASRYYDYPEVGGTYGQATGNAKVPDEPWLASTIHFHNAAGETYFTNGQNLFDPATGVYDITTVGAFAAYPVNVVNEQTAAGSDTYNATSNPDGIDATAADAIFNVLPFSDSSGVRYRVGFRIIDTNRMANLNTGATDDAVAVGDTLGTNIASLRLAPTVAFPNYFKSSDTAANLHIAVGGLGRAGTSGTAFGLGGWESLVLSIENPSTINPLYALFDASDELELRSYGEFGTSYTSRPSSSPVWPNTLGNVTGSVVAGNPVRRSYTDYSFSRLPRPYPDPAVVPYTLTFGAGTYANGGGSFGAPTDPPKDFGVYNVSAPQTITVGTAAHLWPTSPWNAAASKSYQTALPRLAINPPIAADTATPSQTLQQPSQQNWTAMYHLAASATNIATAMERIAGFGHGESCAFAANYVTSLWSGMVQDTNIPSSSDTAYYFPSGPSFVDDQGICVRTAYGISTGSAPSVIVTPYPVGANFGGGGTDLASGGNIYLGFDAQPFINKIGAQSTSDGSGTATSVLVTDSAVELYNPYPVALSTRGYHLVDTVNATDLDLTMDDANQLLYVPAGGYLIITTGTGTPTALVIPPPPPASPAKSNVVVAKYAAFKLVTTGSTTLSLRRPFIDRAFTNQLATVDRASYGAADTGTSIFASANTATGGTPAAIFIGRGDVTNALSMGAPGTVVAGPGPPAPTFGTSAGGAVYNLYDRATLTSVTPTPITNIADFNRIMRIGNVIDNTGAPVLPTGTTPNGLLTERLATLGTAPDTSPSTPAEYPTEAKEAIIHFDFWVDPTLFTNSTLYPTTTTPLGNDPKCDTRAFVLLDCLAPIDRYYASNSSGSPDVGTYRLAGQINVNTASGDVFRALPGVQQTATLYGDPQYPDKLVSNMLAYRDRAGIGARSYNGQANTVDFSVAGTYPGKGIHTLSELLTAVDALAVASSHNPTSIDTRDQVWASIYNLCTVRSDTFAVYGYLEAVKANPLGHNNGTDWYGAASDDAHPAAAIPNIRVGRRRWVAIVDRSYCNYGRAETGFTLPRVVAIKNLPQ